MRRPDVCNILRVPRVSFRLVEFDGNWARLLDCMDVMDEVHERTSSREIIAIYLIRTCERSFMLSFFCSSLKCICLCVKTFNFAENGRHLANQNYRACVRQESNMCSIQYEPCFERAFRIGPRRRINLPGLDGGPQTNGGLLDAAAGSPIQGG